MEEAWEPTHFFTWYELRYITYGTEKPNQVFAESDLNEAERFCDTISTDCRNVSQYQHGFSND